MTPLNYREKFTAFVLFSIGIIFSLLYIVSFVQNQSVVFSSSENNLSISKTHLMDHIRPLMIIFFTISGSILFLKRKNAGWMFSLAILPVFIIMALGGLDKVIRMQIYDYSLYVVLAGIIILLLPVIFLLLPSCRKKFSLNALNYIGCLVLAAIISLVFFVL